MSGRKSVFVTAAFVLSVSLAASFLAVMLVSRYYSGLQFDLLNGICSEILEEEPEAEDAVLTALKEYISANAHGLAQRDILSPLGYRRSDFSQSAYGRMSCFPYRDFQQAYSFFSLPFCIEIKWKPGAFRLWRSI